MAVRVFTCAWCLGKEGRDKVMDGADVESLSSLKSSFGIFNSYKKERKQPFNMLPRVRHKNVAPSHGKCLSWSIIIVLTLYITAIQQNNMTHGYSSSTISTHNKDLRYHKKISEVKSFWGKGSLQLNKNI